MRTLLAATALATAAVSAAQAQEGCDLDAPSAP